MDLNILQVTDFLGILFAYKYMDLLLLHFLYIPRISLYLYLLFFRKCKINDRKTSLLARNLKKQMTALTGISLSPRMYEKEGLLAGCFQAAQPQNYHQGIHFRELSTHLAPFFRKCLPCHIATGGAFALYSN
jgi:hypothetical protein